MKITVTGKDDMKSWHLFGRQAVSNFFSILSFKRKASHQAKLHCTSLTFLAYFFERGFWTFLSTSQHFINCFCLSLLHTHKCAQTQILAWKWILSCENIQMYPDKNTSVHQCFLYRFSTAEWISSITFYPICKCEIALWIKWNKKIKTLCTTI